MPIESKIHATFHISLLELCPNPAVAPQHPPNWPELPPTLEPECVLNKRMGQKKGRIVNEILVKWKNMIDEEASWVLLYQFQK